MNELLLLSSSVKPCELTQWVCAHLDIPTVAAIEFGLTPVGIRKQRHIHICI